MIRKIQIEDAAAICEIYNYYILNSSATFEEDIVTEVQMKERIQKLTLHFPWTVFVEEEKVIAYAYATAWRARAAYRNTVESSIYLHPNARKKGIGTQLYGNLLSILKKRKLHTVIGGVTLPNDSSIALHEKFGFEKVAHFKKVGFKFGQWLDVGYWQLMLNEK